MRFTYFLAVALTGLLASNNAFVAASDDKTVVSEHGQVLSNRELIDTGANANEKRLLRTREDTEDDDEDEDAKTKDDDDDTDDVDDPDYSLIQITNKPRYLWWFENEMTPEDVRKDLRVTEYSLNPVKRSIYKGYIKYYNKHCDYFKNRKKDFCNVDEED